MTFEPIPIGQWDGMRVLTVREPWATLIVTGLKDVENRSRKFGHRGPLLIHASATLTRDYYHDACRWIAGNARNAYLSESFPTFIECKANRGKIIGGCEVSACVFGSTSPWYDGCGAGIVLTRQWKAMEPVPFKGQLSLGTFRKAGVE